MDLLIKTFNINTLSKIKDILKKSLLWENYIMFVLVILSFHYKVSLLLVTLLFFIKWLFSKDDINKNNTINSHFTLIGEHTISRNPHLNFLYEELRIIYRKYGVNIDRFNIYINWGSDYASYTDGKDHYYVINKNELLSLYIKINNNIATQYDYNTFIFIMGHEVWHSLNEDINDITWFNKVIVNNIILLILWWIGSYINTIYMLNMDYRLMEYINILLWIALIYTFKYYIFLIVMQISELIADANSVKIQIKDVDGFLLDTILFFKYYEVDIDNMKKFKNNKFLNNIYINSIFYNTTHPHPRIRIKSLFKIYNIEDQK